MQEINKITGKDYKPFNYYGAPDAEYVIVAMDRSATASMKWWITLPKKVNGRFGKGAFIQTFLS